MKQIIKDVLHDMSAGQIDLSSTGACELIATTITAALKSKGSYKEYTDYELDEQKARASWVCSICGKNTFEIDSDYIGSGTNHLGCEIRLEQDENYRKKNWSQKKHEDKVFGEYAEDIDEQAYAQGRGSSHHIGPDGHYEKSIYEDPGDGSLQLVTNEEKEQMWVDKLVEEVIDDNDTNYIYESPDSGKTVYRRKIGSNERELVKDWKTISGQSKAK